MAGEEDPSLDRSDGGGHHRCRREGLGLPLGLSPPLGRFPEHQHPLGRPPASPSLIDYILVHELAHLHETNHTPEFWAIVARLMPAYETHKTVLASFGKNIWLGSVLKAPNEQSV